MDGNGKFAYGADRTGTGTRIVRRYLLPLIGVPVLLVTIALVVPSSSLISVSLASALAASAVALVLMLGIARRVNALEKELRDLSFNDDLTGVSNLRGFRLLGDQALLESRRQGAVLTVLYFDLNGLKAINDSFGHQAGSRCLVEMAEILKGTFRSSDIIARIGGDEFVVVMRGEPIESMAAVARLADQAKLRNRLSNQPYQIGYSVGHASSSNANSETLMDIVERADRVMYANKRERSSAGPGRTLAEHRAETLAESGSGDAQ